MTAARAAILAAALVFIAVLAALTATAVVNGGFNVLTVVSLVVLALFAFGIVGTLRTPPPPEE
ncbi:MAG: hypothetical protein H0W96_05200 [Solirubrobacterales bacterium]|nr:hypothetical protein [Solirubrobacterales bacterium]